MTSAIGDFDFDRYETGAFELQEAPGRWSAVPVHTDLKFPHPSDFYNQPSPVYPQKEADYYRANIIPLTQEIIKLKSKEASLRKLGNTIHIICAVVGFFFFGAGLIPGILIGWAVNVLVYRRHADEIAAKAKMMQSHLDQISNPIPLRYRA